ncbi:MAG: hypothetical protein WAM66_00740 [Acidobacteriaceae bacterium]
MKRIGLIAAITLFAGVSAAHAQFGSGIVFDPTQSAHAIEQIQQGQQIFTNSVKLADNAIATYNLIHQLSLAPQSLYQPYLSPSTYWTALNQAANTYGNSRQWMNSANTGAGAQYAYQQASIPRSTVLPQYGSLTTSGQQQIAAEGATSDLSDSVTVSSLQTLGTIRADEQKREADIEALESASHSLDPAQQTDMATMQRINQALLLQLRTQQEGNQINETLALQQIVAQKQQQDALKAGFQDASSFSSTYQTQVAPAYNGTAQALTY